MSTKSTSVGEGKGKRAIALELVTRYSLLKKDSLKTPGSKLDVV